jgi:hypothetical protein
MVKKIVNRKIAAGYKKKLNFLFMRIYPFKERD